MTNVDILWIHDYINRKYGGSEWQQDIDSNPYGFYLLQVLPILEEYRSLSKQIHKIQFLKPTESIVDMDVNQEKIQNVIHSFLQIIQTYFENEYIHNEWDKIRYGIHQKPQDFKKSSHKHEMFEDDHYTQSRPLKRKCSLCQTDFDEFQIYDNHWICPCGFVSDTTHSTNSYKDIDRINLTSKYMYDRRIHFRDCINQYQGKQNSKIDPDIYKELIQQLLSHGLIPENYEDIPKEIAFEQVTKEHILLFLKEIKQTKHYEDLILIHHQLTGQPIQDISHLESQLLNDFDILVETYDRLYKNSERKNFINTQYVLFQLLRRHKYPCKKEDFNMLKTIDRKYFHDTVCSELFAEIGWSFTALF